MFPKILRKILSLQPNYWAKMHRSINMPFKLLSLMNVMAREGYDVWTMDHDGYGYSGSSGNNSDVASGVEDLKAAVPVVARAGRGRPTAAR